MTRRIVCLAFGIMASFAAPTVVGAQKRVGLSPGFAVGSTLSGYSTRSEPAGAWARGGHLLATLDVEKPGWPVRLRGEAMAVARSHNHGPVSLGASVILPVGGGRFRPYALAGTGIYGVGGVGHPIGWSAGGGAEYRRRTATIFVEARHQTQTPSAVSLGVRF